MKKPKVLDGTLCQICGKRIETDFFGDTKEPCEWVKTKKKPQKTLWFHRKCYEKELKKG